MKKIVAVLIFYLAVLPALAEIFFEPKWEDFCPKKFVNINPDSWHYTASGRYWAQRKKVFNERLEKCNSLNEASKEACYNSLRELEVSATQLRNQEISAGALKYMMINSMF